MEERKTAAIVLGIIAVIAMYYIWLLPEIKFRSTQTLLFKTCTVHFKYFDKGLINDTYRASNNKLALCLCNVYKKNHDTVIANKIIKLYRQYGSHLGYDSVGFNKITNLDSIIKNKSAVFDTLVLID